MAEVDSIFLGLRRVFFGKLSEVPKPKDEEEIRGDFFHQSFIFVYCLILCCFWPDFLGALTARDSMTMG